MSPFNLLKSVKNQTIPVSDWGNRVDPGVNQAQMQPMRHVSESPRTHRPTPHRPKISAAPLQHTHESPADENYAKWIRDIGAPDHGAPFTPMFVEDRPETLQEPTVEYTPPHVSAPKKETVQQTKPTERNVDSDVLSVNSSELRIDTAGFHLRTLGLPRNASWEQIAQRHRALLAELATRPQTLPGEAEEIEAKRRSYNIAYACLRLVAGRRLTTT